MSMGIYIKGMEMPTYEQGDIVLRVRWDGRVDKDNSGNTVATAVPVPPHGRLIDADAQDVQIEALIERHLHGYTKSTWDFVCELRDILKRNRTIIQADPAEEGE